MTEPDGKLYIQCDELRHWSVDKLRIRVVCYILMLILLLTGSAVGEQSQPLAFDENGTFRVLLLADTQDTDNPQQAMLNLLNACLDQSEPDMVIFLGDMIHGPAIRGEENVQKAIDAIVQPVVQRGLPFALVFGNHDEECGISNERQMEIYHSYPGCLAVEGKEMPGCGNYCYVIENPAQPSSPLVFWFLDSGNHAEPGRGTYGYVKPEQNRWMLEELDGLKQTYASPISYVFQHIPVPQVYDMLLEVPFGTRGAVTCYGPRLFKWYKANPDYIWEGDIGEGPCSSDYDSGEFDTWKQMGVRAAFFGHDHLNNYCGTLNGIDLVATPGMGFYAYGRGGEHGARLLTFHADNPSDWKSEMLYYRDVVSEPLPGLFIASLGVMIQTWVFIGVPVLLLLIVGLILLLRSLRKNRKKKKHAPT